MRAYFSKIIALKSLLSSELMKDKCDFALYFLFTNLSFCFSKQIVYLQSTAVSNEVIAFPAFVALETSKERQQEEGTTIAIEKGMHPDEWGLISSSLIKMFNFLVLLYQDLTRSTANANEILRHVPFKHFSCDLLRPPQSIIDILLTIVSRSFLTNQNATHCLCLI